MNRKDTTVNPPENLSAISVLKTLEAVDVLVLVARYVVLRPAGWNIPTFTSTHWRLYQHDLPGGALNLDGSEFPIDPRRVYLIPPRLSFGTICHTPCRQFFVHFELAGFPAVALHDLFPGPVALPESRYFEASVEEFSTQLGSEEPTVERGLGLHYRIKAIVFEALSRAVDLLSEDRLSVYLNRLSALEPVMPALEEIRGRIGDKLPNSELAALCCMSRDYFIRKFNIALGVSPAQYIVERRVALAAHRLRFTADSLDEIAESVGFRNRFYLTRVFTREMGVPPATYRRLPHA